MHNKIASIFTSVFDIPMTTPTALDICNRVADKAKPEQKNIYSMCLIFKLCQD